MDLSYASGGRFLYFCFVAGVGLRLDWLWLDIYSIYLGLGLDFDWIRFWSGFGVGLALDFLLAVF